MALGLIRPTSGRVEVLGRDVARYGARVLPRVGALVESPALYQYMSGRDNLRAFASVLGGVERARLDNDATHALVVIGIYAAVFLAVSMVLTRRRDVLQ